LGAGGTLWKEKKATMIQFAWLRGISGKKIKISKKGVVGGEILEIMRLGRGA